MALLKATVTFKFDHDNNLLVATAVATSGGTRFAARITEPERAEVATQRREMTEKVIDTLRTHVRKVTYSAHSVE